MRKLYTIFFTIIALLALLFAVSNSDQVIIHYYFGQLSMPLSLSLGIALAIGSILGAMGCLKMILCAKYELRLLKQEINLAKKEIANLRAIPIKDSH